MTHNKNVANLIAVIVFAACLALWFWGGLRSRDELLILSGLVVISILPIYRRTTDLGLFVLPLIWALKNKGNTLALPIAAGAALFFVPINSVLARYDVYGPLSLIQSWIVLTLAIFLIFAQWRQSVGKTSSVNLRAAGQTPH